MLFPHEVPLALPPGQGENFKMLRDATAGDWMVRLPEDVGAAKWRPQPDRCLPEY